MTYNFFEIDIHYNDERRYSVVFARAINAKTAKEAWNKMADINRCKVSRVKMEYYIDNTQKQYKVEVEDDNFEIILAENPTEAELMALESHDVVYQIDVI